MSHRLEQSSTMRQVARAAIPAGLLAVSLAIPSLAAPPNPTADINPPGVLSSHTGEGEAKYYTYVPILQTEINALDAIPTLNQNWKFTTPAPGAPEIPPDQLDTYTSEYFIPTQYGDELAILCRVPHYATGTTDNSIHKRAEFREMQDGTGEEIFWNPQSTTERHSFSTRLAVAAQSVEDDGITPNPIVVSQVHGGSDDILRVVVEQVDFLGRIRNAVMLYGPDEEEYEIMLADDYEIGTFLNIYMNIYDGKYQVTVQTESSTKTLVYTNRTHTSAFFKACAYVQHDQKEQDGNEAIVAIADLAVNHLPAYRVLDATFDPGQSQGLRNIYVPLVQKP